MNVAPICAGVSNPISRKRGPSRGSCQDRANSNVESGPGAFRVPTSIRSSGVPFHSEQSSNTSQNARTIVSVSVPGSGLATGSQ